MSEPTKEELAAMPDFLIRYMAPMNGPGKPYREEYIRRLSRVRGTEESWKGHTLAGHFND